MNNESTITSQPRTSLFLQKDKDAQGFTIIEMLLAITLSAVIMVAVLGQLGSIRRPSAAPVPAHPPSEARFVSLIEKDLTKTTSLQASDGVLTLYTYRALAPDTMAETHRPMTVRYRVVEHADEHWLVRDQKHFSPEQDGQDDWTLRTPLKSNVLKVRWSAPNENNSALLSNADASDRGDQPELDFDSNHTGPTTTLHQSVLPWFIQIELFSAADASEPTRTLRLASGNLFAQPEQSPPASGGDY